MKSSQKKGIIIALVLIVIVALIALILMNQKNKEKEVSVEPESETYTKELEDGTKINISEEFNQTKTYNGLEISNIQFTEKNGMSVLLADVKNTGKTKHEVEIVKITIIGKDGEEITTIKPIIGDIEAGEKIKLNASITADVTNAKDFKIEPKE